VTATIPLPDRAAPIALRRSAPWVAVVAAVVVLQVVFRASETFPSKLDTWLSDPIDRMGGWLRSNRSTHPLFTGFLTPVSTFVGGIIDGITDFLLWAPWFAVIGLVLVLPLSRRMWAAAAVIVGCFVYIGVFDLWEPSMETLSLMSTSVLLAVVLGVPVGVVAAARPGVERAIRPVLDAMQTIPAFVYFLPLFMLLGIGNVPAAVTTVIYALPPVVRLTTLGIKQVPGDTVEASAMFGASPVQTMLKVQLPMAIRTIVTGMSQTVMMALGIVVLATLIGAGGLGSPIFESLNQRRPGRGLAAGFAIVGIAMVIDRLARAAAERNPAHRVRLRTTIGIVGAVAVATVVGRAAGITTFPKVWDWTAWDFIDDGVTWVRDNLRGVTRWINDTTVTKVYLPARDFVADTIAWPVVVLLVGLAGWRLRSWQLGAFAAAAVAWIGLEGMWVPAIETLVQVVISTIIALAIAFPVGVLAGRNRRVEAILRPVLDTFQTMPAFVYIIPVVVWFTVGVVPGIVATVAYAMVPGIAITALGIREVASESIEAAQTFGATPRQVMFGVRIPLAAPTLMAAVNQVIMMALAMAIIAGMVGGAGLGYQVFEALQRSYFGQGFEAGLALVLMAMVLDRFTEAAADHLRPPTSR
jgi:glycine betaine/proline transport system permease protein